MELVERGLALDMTLDFTLRGFFFGDVSDHANRSDRSLVRSRMTKDDRLTVVTPWRIEYSELRNLPSRSSRAKESVTGAKAGASVDNGEPSRSLPDREKISQAL